MLSVAILHASRHCIPSYPSTHHLHLNTMETITVVQHQLPHRYIWQ